METNKSIGCTVDECAYNNERYCTLDQIDVVKSSITDDAETIEYTDCGSYRKRK